MTENESKSPTPTKKPFYKRGWFIALASIFVIGSIANANNKGGETSSQPQETVTVTASPLTEQTPLSDPSPSEASPSPQKTVNVDSDFNVASFRSSAKGNVADLKKDLSDLGKRAEEGSLLRLMGNIIEISFNQGQLSALTDVPTKISKTWPLEMANLEKAVDALSDETSSFVGGDTSLAKLKQAISKVNGIADKLAALAGKL